MATDREQRLALLQSDLAALVRKATKRTVKWILEMTVGYAVITFVVLRVWPEAVVGQPWGIWWLDVLEELVLVVGLFYGLYLLVRVAVRVLRRIISS